MFNCLYNTPISYCNPAPLPVAINYISGMAKGFNVSAYSGFNGTFSGTSSCSYTPQTYNFKGNSSYGSCFSGVSSNKVYNFTGNVSVAPVATKTYNFTGGMNSSLVPTQSFNFTGSSSSAFAADKQNNIKDSSASKKTNPSKSTNKPEAKKAENPSNHAKPQAQQNTSNNVDLRRDFVNVAYKYNGVSEADGSHKKFCINIGCNPFNDGEWCTDFVTYVVKESYRNNGKHVPAGFGDHDVETLKNWAIRNDYFTRTSNKSNTPSFIAQNIKPGDIMILNENYASHTGFVTRVDNDGTFHTIEGNRGDKVTTATYRPGSEEYRKNLSGFIQLA